MAVKKGAPSKYTTKVPAKYLEIIKRPDVMCKATACVELGISKDTLWRWSKKYEALSDAIKEGEGILEDRWVKEGLNIMRGNVRNANPTIYIWLTKNILKYTDKVETKSTMSIDGIEFDDEE